MTPAEEPIVFDCRGERLCGVVHRPAGGSVVATTEPSDVGIVIIVGGPQYRAGSHRQFVTLARRLALAGHTVLRFDVRGMGDSSGKRLGFEQLDADIDAAVNELMRREAAVRRVVLWGLCDGASAALLYSGSVADGRIAGLCLLNPWARTEATLAKTHVRHYYGKRLLQPVFWSKLFRGGIRWAALSGFAGSVRKAASASTGPGDYRDAMSRAFGRFSKPILLVLSGADLTAREFELQLREDSRWQTTSTAGRVRRIDLPQADHTLTRPADRTTMETAMLEWLQRAVA